MIRVLVLSQDTDGIGYYRNFMPHLTIDENNFEIDIRMFQDGTMNLLDPNFIGKYNIIFYNKAIPFIKDEYFIAFNQIVKSFNIKVVYDIDDYWELNSSHANYSEWKKTKADEPILKALMESDHITTTTSLFADRIKEINPNVTVLPNAVNLEEQQWRFNRKPSNKIRFLWGGGISHMADLRLLKSSFEKFDKKFLNEAQLFLCGYDLRMRTPKGMVQKSDPKTNLWSFFEDLFSFRGRYISNPEHKKYLHSYDDKNYGINEKFIDEFYQRRWTRPILNYGHMYNEADVCLAPLKNNNMFNFYKSNLKVIEAGAHHCPIIASNFGPYTMDDIEGKKDGKQKGFLINQEDTYGWLKAMKYYSENTDAMRQHGENLYEYIKDNYSMDVIKNKRLELYQKLTVK